MVIPGPFSPHLVIMPLFAWASGDRNAGHVPPPLVLWVPAQPSPAQIPLEFLTDTTHLICRNMPNIPTRPQGRNPSATCSCCYKVPRLALVVSSSRAQLTLSVQCPSRAEVYFDMIPPMEDRAGPEPPKSRRLSASGLEKLRRRGQANGVRRRLSHALEP